MTMTEAPQPCSPWSRTKVHAMHDGEAPIGAKWEAMLATAALWAAGCRGAHA
jgi:hypothetical protein